MKVTVVGGCGFIGSHLVDRLCQDGHNVYVVDNKAYSVKYNVQARGARLFIRGLAKWVREPRGAYGFMLLGHGAAHDYNKDPRGGSGLFSRGMDITSKFARESRGGFMCVSDVGRCGRNYRPYGFYIASRRLGEECAKHSINQMGVRGHILRLYPTYGPRMTSGRLVSDMITSARAGQDIVIYGDGTEMVSPVHVLDVVDAMIACMNLSESIVDPLVIGGDTMLSLLDLAKLVKKLTKSKSKIVFVEMEADKPVEVDLAAAEKILGWKPKISLEDGLKQFI